MHQLRSCGRVISVFIGGLVGAWLLSVDPSDTVLALSVVGALACAAATRGSRWYVSPLFSTFLVILMLLVSNYSARAQPLRPREADGERRPAEGIGVGEQEPASDEAHAREQKHGVHRAPPVLRGSGTRPSRSISR
jgi:hypothetical protein